MLLLVLHIQVRTILLRVKHQATSYKLAAHKLAERIVVVVTSNLILIIQENTLFNLDFFSN